MAHFLQRQPLFDEGFCRDQPVLGHTMIKAGAHFLPEQLGDGAGAYIELLCRLLQGDLPAQIGFDVCQHFIEKIRLFRLQNGGGPVPDASAHQRQQGNGISHHRRLPSGLGILRFPNTSAEKLAQKFPLGSPGSQQRTGFHPDVLQAKHPYTGLHKFLAEPENIPLIGLFHFFRQQRPVADAGRHQHNIAPAQQIAVRTHQILGAAVIEAKQHFIEGVAVQVQLGIGIGHIPVGLHKGVGHFQLLIKVLEINALTPQGLLDGLQFLRGGRRRKPAGKLPQNR